MSIQNFKLEQSVNHKTWGLGKIIRKTKILYLVKFKIPLPLNYNCGCQFAYCSPEELEAIDVL